MDPNIEEDIIPVCRFVRSLPYPIYILIVTVMCFEGSHVYFSYRKFKKLHILYCGTARHFFLNEFILRTLIRDFESYGMSTFVVCGIHTVLIS